jgi:signal transduction histidine kinase
MLRALSPFRLPARTARFRLTLIYSGMFLLLGTAVIVAILLLARGGSSGVAKAVPAPIQRPAAVILKQGAVQQHSADVNRLVIVAWLALAVAAVGAAVLGWFASGRVLRPLRHMAATAQTISAGNLHERLALQGPNDEIKRLGDTLDDLLSRLEASFEAQRRFVANASHELRTPVTVERALLQVALAEPDTDAEKLRATCEELPVSGREQERLIEALLTLASSERGLERREAVDLGELANRVLGKVELGISREGLHRAPTTGDPALLERLTANLIDNAVRHNDDRGEVMVRTHSEAGRSLLIVTNTGPIVPAEEVDRLFEPFERLDGSRAARAAGHGLGLSIVRAIALAHDATVAAEPLAGGGLAVTVNFKQQDASSDAGD